MGFVQEIVDELELIGRNVEMTKLFGCEFESCVKYFIYNKSFIEVANLG